MIYISIVEHCIYYMVHEAASGLIVPIKNKNNPPKKCEYETPTHAISE